MIVKENNVTVRCVQSNSFGQPVLVHHQVVVDHNLRSRMLLTLFRHLRDVTLEDVKRVLDLVEEYLAEPRRLHSYYKWSRTVNQWLIGLDPEMNSGVIDQLLRIKAELKHCWPFEQEEA